MRRLREPFLLFAGYGQTGELLGKSFDALGQQFVVIDQSSPTASTRSIWSPTTPTSRAWPATSRNPHHLAVAGLDHPYCSGVLALTSDDEVNLAVTMAAALLRPELPVIARTVSPAIEYRMQAFGTPSVVNPFDRFGDHLRLALRAPASYQLLTWLESGPGAAARARPGRRRRAAGCSCGYGRFGKELAADLRAEGLEVTIIEPMASAGQDPAIIVGDASEPAVMEKVDLATAVGFVAGTDNDTTNLSLVAAARRINPNLFVAARQNHAGQRAAVRRRCSWIRCWCPPRWWRTRCTRSSAPRCCGGSCRRCRRRATTGRPRCSSGSPRAAAAACRNCGRSG